MEKLIDNYNQARGCMSRMETRLVRKGRIAEFNRQFQDNVDRGVFKPISREQADQYKGAVNYVHQHGGGIQNGALRYHSSQDLHEQQHEAATAIRGKLE